MTLEQYLQMCEQMGWEPQESEMPLDPSELSEEVQQTLIVLNSLPDMWDGMSGSWLGKNYSGLGTILDIYEIEDRKTVFALLKQAETQLGKFYEEKRKQQESMNKAKRGR